MDILNSFGIKPTNTFVSAGTDYYVPNIDDNDITKRALALNAFEKSYGINSGDIVIIKDRLSLLVLDDHKDTNQICNLIHFFLAVGNKELDKRKSISLAGAVDYFYENYVIWDKDDKCGVALKLNDTLFINSGIKVALDTAWNVNGKEKYETVRLLKNLGFGIAGLYVNKSGKGNAGFDIRACLVDEDYSGYVHLSMAYTKDLFKEGKNFVYAGDKLVQMMLIPIIHTTYNERNEYDYNEIMSQSKRGDSGFGSSDVKH